jgi:integrase
MHGEFAMSRQMQGYWATHPYIRLNVKDYSEEWVGYEPLLELIELASQPREQAFLSALFLTGGRTSEVLSLRKNMFEIRKRERVIVVRNMPLLKRYRKLSEVKDGKGRKWITEKLQKTRMPFPILLKEPLVPYLLNWIEALPNEDSLLFESPYNVGKPLTRFWAYHVIRDLDNRLTPELRSKLGLHKAFIKDGKIVKDRLHLWLHWFRSQRACCLVSEFNFQLHELLDYFSWEHIQTAMDYAKKGWRGLAEKMLRKK